MWHLVGSGMEPVPSVLAGVLFDCWATRAAHFWDVWRHCCWGKPELVTEILVHVLPSGCLEGISARFHGWGLKSRPALQKETFSASPCVPAFPPFSPTRSQKFLCMCHTDQSGVWTIQPLAWSLPSHFLTSPACLSCFVNWGQSQKLFKIPFKIYLEGPPWWSSG